MNFYKKRMKYIPAIIGTVEELRFWGVFLDAGTMDLIVYDMVEWDYTDK